LQISHIMRTSLFRDASTGKRHGYVTFLSQT
jgi:hypothetical protein